MNWRCLGFEELDSGALYAVLRLRAAVFVVEQDCPFQDCDDLDASALHLLAEDAGGLCAYMRLHAPGIRRPEAVLSRIVTAPAARARGLGRELMRRGLDEADRRWPDAEIHIDAQARLQRFYRDFGFSACSAPFLEDGIVHIAMRRSAAGG